MLHWNIHRKKTVDTHLATAATAIDDYGTVIAAVAVNVAKFWRSIMVPLQATTFEAFAATATAVIQLNLSTP